MPNNNIKTIFNSVFELAAITPVLEKVPNKGGNISQTKSRNISMNCFVLFDKQTFINLWQLPAFYFVHRMLIHRTAQIKDYVVEGTLTMFPLWWYLFNFLIKYLSPLSSSCIGLQSHRHHNKGVWGLFSTRRSHWSHWSDK